MTPDQASLVFTQSWESFLGKLSIPVTEELIDAGDVCRRYLRAVAVAMYSEPPRTLIHNDVQGNNLLVAEDGEPSLAVVDWQLTTAGRPAPDLARFLVGYLDTADRRGHEDRLLQIYHSLLTERGVTDYSLKQCRDDYRMALVMTASRLATGVGLASRRDRDAWWILEHRFSALRPGSGRPRRGGTPLPALRLDR